MLVLLIDILFTGVPNLYSLNLIILYTSFICSLFAFTFFVGIMLWCLTVYVFYKNLPYRISIKTNVVWWLHTLKVSMEYKSIQNVNLTIELSNYPQRPEEMIHVLLSVMVHDCFWTGYQNSQTKSMCIAHISF